MGDTTTGISVDHVLGQLNSCAGCIPRPDLDLDDAHVYVYQDPMDPSAQGKFFFVPKPPFGDDYTKAQLEEIVETCQFHGIPIPPLWVVRLN